MYVDISHVHLHRKLLLEEMKMYRMCVCMHVLVSVCMCVTVLVGEGVIMYMSTVRIELTQKKRVV